MHQAKTHLSRLVEQAAQEEEIVIAKAGKPMARLVALQQPRKAKRRGFGALKGKMKLLPGWDDPMTQEELAEWYDSKLLP
ncbi:MAG TPA: type II toxin-antitoxin system prevent-host-death family antitoxin [Burkholderiales bacterium]|nr:type II toxin-antitoxin system prevent-host-death family antitoxin [Burkholderiales bacterium]